MKIWIKNKYYLWKLNKVSKGMLRKAGESEDVCKNYIEIWKIIPTKDEEYRKFWINTLTKVLEIQILEKELDRKIKEISNPARL